MVTRETVLRVNGSRGLRESVSPAFSISGETMGRGRVTPDETIEKIKATYALNGNARETSRVLGVSFETVRKYISPDDKDQFSQIRSEKRIDIIEKAKDVQIKLLEAMIDPKKLAEAKLSEVGVAFGIVTEKIQLLSGEATERHEHRDSTESRNMLLSRVDELAARRRSRNDTERTLGATGT
jgi:hypothetical protein